MRVLLAALVSALGIAHAAPLPVPAAEYAARRAAVLARMTPHSLAVVRSAPVAQRTTSSEYPYRQSNTLLYLCGADEPDVTLVLSPMSLDSAGDHAVLFVWDRSPAAERWTGAKPGPSEAAARYGLPALSEATMDSTLARVLRETDTLYYDWSFDVLKESLPLKPTIPGLSEGALVKERWPSVAKVLPAHTLCDSMRTIKSSAELSLMQRAIEATCAGHRAVMAGMRALRAAGAYGCTEIAAARIFDLECAKHHVSDVAYPDIVGDGANACVLHHDASDAPLVDGDVVVMDCGGEYDGYAADVTRTFPVNGKFSADQRAIYDIVLRAQRAAIAEVRAGAPLNATHKRAFAVIAKGLFDLGIVTSRDADVADPEHSPLSSLRLGNDSVRRYFPHGTSHTLGLDVHDTKSGDTLRANMVITVEPGIYIPAGSPCDKRWWNIGVRIEDDVLVTSNHSEVLSSCVPKDPEAIEKLMGE